MGRYFFEFRLSSKQHLDQWTCPKSKIESAIYHVREKFNLDKLKEKKLIIPHITFFQPFNSNNIKDIINHVNNRLQTYNDDFSEKLVYSIDNTKILEYNNNKALVLNIKPSQDMLKINDTIAKSVLPYCDMSQLESHGAGYMKWDPHITLVDNKEVKDKFYTIARSMEDYLSDNKIIPFEDVVARVTVLEREGRNWFIHKEYDFTHKKWLSRSESLDPTLWRKTALYLEYARYNNRTKLKL